MNNRTRIRMLAQLTCLCLTLTSCTSIRPTITHQYTLGAFHATSQQHRPGHNKVSIFINKSEAAAGYQTEQMLYIKQPYALDAFAHNAWVDAPANMLTPLIVQNLQATGYFSAVVSNNAAADTDYQIDTQLIALQQNFLYKPSVIELVVKVVLSRGSNNHALASRIIYQRVPCKTNTPYGGVLAANQATLAFIKELTQFILLNIRPLT